MPSTTCRRRERGYSFEKHIVDSFNKDRWTARRLGGSSTGLPDVVATSSGKQMLFSMECKSTVSDACYVPTDQLVRCHEILRMFDMYSYRYIILAFKFAKPKTKDKKLQYWYFVVDDYAGLHNIRTVKCTRSGRFELYQIEDNYQTFMITRRFEKLDEIMELEPVPHPISVDIIHQT